MENIHRLSGDELHELINENLKTAGVEPDLISIKIKKGSRIHLEGELDSRRIRDLIMQTITDIVGVDKVVDDTHIIDDSEEDIYDDDRDDSELFDEDNECVGTEDVFRAVEDGLPYIPPTTSRFDELEQSRRRKKERRESDIYW